MTVVVVVAVAMLLGLALILLNVARRRAQPLDTERQERWLVRHAPRRLQRALRYADRRVAGGAIAALAFVALFAGAVIVGWLFDSVDSTRGFARWDRSLADWGARHATDRSTDVLAILTHFGSTLPVWIVLVIVGLAHAKKLGWGALGYLALVGVGINLLNNLLKLIVDRERPDVMQIGHPAGSSFPSGHSATAAACWAAIMLVVFARSSWRYRLLGGVLAVLIAAMVATTRVLLGVHWLTDVLAGVTVGWTWFFLSTILFGGRLLRFGEPVDRLATGDVRPARPDAAALTDHGGSERP